MLSSESEEVSTKPTNALEERQRHDRLMGIFVSEAYRQSNNRARMARCEGYYDQYQITAEQRAKVEARGQTVVLLDQITTPIDWLLGTERRTRIDSKILPRQSIDAQATKDSENKTALLKWINDSNRTQFERSYTWDDAMKAGAGWTEVGAQPDDPDCAVFVAYSPWRNNLHDSLAERRDLRDRAFHFRMKVVDLGLALAHFPNKRTELIKVRQNATDLNTITSFAGVPGTLLDLQALYGMADRDPTDEMPMMGSGAMFNPRERVLLIEAWTMEPVTDQTPENNYSAAQTPRMRPLVTIMTEFDTLFSGWSPYDHNLIPFVPMWAYREKRTGFPYSPIRRLMDKQDAINKAVSRAMHEINTEQIHTEADAIDDEVMDIEQIRDEVNDPNGVVVLATGGLQKFKVIKGLEEARVHMQMVEMFANNMTQTSSVTRENRGESTAGASGKAIDLKQEQGGVLSAELFDGLLLHDLMVGELTLSVAEQFIVDPIVVPVTGERGQLSMLALNQPEDESTHLGRLRARFVVSEQAWRANLGRAMFEGLLDLLGKLAPMAPQVVTAMLDLVFEYADIPNKETMLERIRNVTGQAGPDNKLTPEQEQQKAKGAAMANAEFNAKLGMLQAQVREANAKGAKLDAEGIAKSLEGIYMAAQAAQVAQVNPGVALMADALLESVGFQDKSPGPVFDPAAVVPQPGAQPAPSAQPVPPMPTQNAGALVGHEAGIQTPGADGAIPQEQ
jgi:hypothetical protein